MSRNAYFHPPDSPTIRLRVLSLGAGVQSTTLALMAAHGEITPMPDCAIFADTQWEPNAVYEHLRWLEKSNALPFPIFKVSKDSIREGLLRFGEGKRFSSVPLYSEPEKEGGREGQLPRQCTADLKIYPVRRKIRELAGLHKKRSPSKPIVEQWIGISMDEIWRARPCRDEPWMINRFPLLEKRMTRNDCLEWIRKNEYPVPPKSACIGCPYLSDKRWLELKEGSPEEFADAVRIDSAVRNGGRQELKQKLYLHSSCLPLDQVPFEDIIRQRDAAKREQPDMFNDECEGMCGV